MPHLESQSAELKQHGKKKMDMGVWLTIVFGMVLLTGFALMLIDIVLG